MGKEADANVNKKVPEIIQEVRAAQAAGSTPQEILHRISFYVKENPSLIIPLIDGLAALPTPQTALLLEGMMTALQDKRAIKAIKRTLYRFRHKGVQWEERPSPERSVLRPPEQGAPQGYMGAMDATGSRIIVVARPRPHGGMRTYFSILSDQEGIQRLEVTDLSKKGVKEFIAASLSSEEFPVVEAPGGYCVHLLHEAAALTRRLGRTLPRGYGDVERELRDVTWDGPAPLIYHYIPEEAVKNKPRLLKESGTLHRITPFSSWFLNPEDLVQYAEAIREAEKSHLVLTPQQKDARLNSIYRDALEGLFPKEQRLLWKRRLEETAYILWKKGKEHEARMAVSAAVDLTAPFSPLEPNPFCWNLLLKSLYGLLETERGEQVKEKKSSLVITP
jgi:hypothetical protein